MNTLQKHYLNLSKEASLPEEHIDYLRFLKDSGIEPKVIYDIGSCVLHWTKEAEKIWPDAEIILFEANPNCEFLYSAYRYHIGVLSHTSNMNLKFYLNEFSPGGASYYREIGSPISGLLYPSHRYYKYKTSSLDDIVSSKDFPLPDLIKIDVQGAEMDVLLGGRKTFENAKNLILELPKLNVQYNENAPTASQTLELVKKMGWICSNPLFSDNGQYDGDFGFVR